MRRSRIRRRLILIGVLLIAGIGAASAMIIAMQRTAALQAYEEALVNLGVGMAKQTTQSIATIDLALREIRQATVTMGASSGPMVPPQSSRDMAELLANRRKYLPFVETLALISAEGRIVASSRGVQATGYDVSDRDFFRHLSTHHDPELFVGVPQASRVNDRMLLFLARRINDAQGRFAGLVVAGIALADLEKFYELAMPPRRSVALVRRDGIVLLRYPHLGDDIGQPIPATSPWYATMAAGGGIFRSPGGGAKPPAVVTAHRLGDLPFVIDVYIPESLILAGWWVQMGWVLLGAFGATIGVILLLRLFAAQLHRLEASEASLAGKNAELQIMHQQFDLALSNLSQGVCFFNGEQKLIVCNRRYGEIYRLPAEVTRPGVPLAVIVAQRIAAGSGPDTSGAEYLTAREEVAKSTGLHYSVVKLMDGRTIAIQHQPMPDGGWVATHEDITARVIAEDKIAYLARHDALTGLANRVVFRERLEQALAGVGRGEEFAVLYLDLDRFKAVNDTYGHQIGDALLRAVAERLLACVRETDLVARLGGDEFIVLQTAVKLPEHAAILAGRLIRTLSAPYRLGERTASIGTSVGIAIAPRDGTSADTLVRKSDRALYASKSEGRGMYRFYTPEMESLLPQAVALEAAVPGRETNG